MKLITILLPAALCMAALLPAGCGGGRNAGDAVPEPAVETDLFVFDLEGSIEKSPKATSLNELADSIVYLPLETPADALLSDRNALAKITSDFFIGAGGFTSTAPIFQFDSLGRFVQQVTRYGRGPGEVSISMGWYAHRSLRQINVVSTGGSMIVTEPQTGKRMTIGIDERQGFSRVPLGDSTFVSAPHLFGSSSHDAKLFFTDRGGNTVHSVARDDELRDYNYSRMPEGAWSGPYEDYKLWADYTGDALFQDIFNDTIYRVRSYREITPHLIFKRGALSPDPRDTYNREQKRRQVYFSGLRESGDHVFLSYYHDGKVWQDVWSKRDGDLLLRTVSEMSGSAFEAFVPFALPDGSVIELQIAYADGENIYGIMEALDACRFLSGVREDDNPVIVIATLKK